MFAIAAWQFIIIIIMLGVCMCDCKSKNKKGNPRILLTAVKVKTLKAWFQLSGPHKKPFIFFFQKKKGKKKH